MDYRVYGITDCTMDLPTLLDSVEKAVKGGITVLQYRAKLKDIPEMLEEVKAIQEIIRPYNVPLIINDYPDVAKVSGADGVHLGQSDMNPKAVREYLGDSFIIGLSVGNQEELKKLDVSVVDYIGVGAVYPTDTKNDAGESIGVEGFADICNRVIIPVVAIGGLTYNNAGAVIEKGADGIAMITEIFRADDIITSTQKIKGLWQ